MKFSLAGRLSDNNFSNTYGLGELYKVCCSSKLGTISFNISWDEYDCVYDQLEAEIIKLTDFNQLRCKNDKRPNPKSC